MQFVTERNEII